MILILYLDLLDNNFINYNYNNHQPFVKIFGKNIFEYILDNIYDNSIINLIILYNNEKYKNIISNIINKKYKVELNLLLYNNSNNSNNNNSNNIFSLLLNILNNDYFKNLNEYIFFLDTNFLYIENIINIYKSYNKNNIFYIESNDSLHSEKNLYIKFD